MLFTALLLIAASGVSLAQQQCTEAYFPSKADARGEFEVPIGPIELPGVISNVTFSNTCLVTNALMVSVCDNSVPAIMPMSLYFLTVQRLSSVVGPAYLSGIYYCD